MISIVLIEPENPGNIGAIARAMKNFDLNKLVLVNPKCRINQESKNRAKWAQDILKNAKVAKFDYLKKFHTLVATTSQLGTDYNIPRSPITPEQLASKLNVNKNIAVLFGREGIGLRNEEIQMCDFVVTIPTSKKYPTMNISHSAAIVFYEIFKAIGKNKVGEQIKIAGKAEKEHLMKLINLELDKMEFATPSKKKTQQMIWKRIIGKSFLTRREIFALMGFFKKLN